jgi:hypothetical protein
VWYEDLTGLKGTNELVFVAGRSFEVTRGLLGVLGLSFRNWHLLRFEHDLLRLKSIRKWHMHSAHSILHLHSACNQRDVHIPTSAAIQNGSWSHYLLSVGNMVAATLGPDMIVIL